MTYSIATNSPFIIFVGITAGLISPFVWIITGPSRLSNVCKAIVFCTISSPGSDFPSVTVAINCKIWYPDAAEYHGSASYVSLYVFLKSLPYRFNVNGNAPVCTPSIAGPA